MLRLLEGPHSEKQAVEVTGTTGLLLALALQLIHSVNGQVASSLQASVFFWVNIRGWDEMLYNSGPQPFRH